MHTVLFRTWLRCFSIISHMLKHRSLFLFSLFIFWYFNINEANIKLLMKKTMQTAVIPRYISAFISMVRLYLFCLLLFYDTFTCVDEGLLRSSVIYEFISFKSVTQKCFRPIRRSGRFETVRSFILIFPLTRSQQYSCENGSETPDGGGTQASRSVCVAPRPSLPSPFTLFWSFCHAVFMLNCVCVFLF